MVAGWLETGYFVLFLCNTRYRVSPLRPSMQTAPLFRSVPNADVLRFGEGSGFQPKRVAEFMELDANSISKIALVSKTSVRWDDKVPKQVVERLEEIGAVANMVAEFFNGDAHKTALWFRTKNPMLGDVSPRDMVRLGRYDRLRRFIISAMQDDQG